MALYEFRCKEHGRFEDFYTTNELTLGPPHSLCPTCGDWCEKVPSPPTLGVASFGRDLWVNRTPEHERKSYTDEQERKRHAIKRDLGITTRPVMKG